METLIEILLTGFLSSICTIAAVKTDIKWIISTLRRHESRLNSIERERKNYREVYFGTD